MHGEESAYDKSSALKDISRLLPGFDGKHLRPVISTGKDTRWWALIALCSGALMIVLDAAVVVVALPPIGVDLNVSDSSIVWVVNAYLIPYAGCRLFAGRLGDVFGHRRLFLSALMFFSLASITCAAAQSWIWLLIARAFQGAAGAAVVTGAGSLIIIMFNDGKERAKAIGIYGFVCSVGGAAGVLVSGTVTSILGWRWLFLLNLPTAAVVYVVLWAARGSDRASLVRRAFHPP